MICFIFIIYLIIYLWAWICKVPIKTLEIYYFFLHLILVGSIVFYGLKYLKTYRNVEALLIQISKKNLLFWTALTLGFLIPGAYLEYPSDPWAHFARLSVWSSQTFISENVDRWKFSYFWGWTLLNHVPLSLKHTALGIYSAFWQILISIQFYKFARNLGMSVAMCRLQLIGFFCLFGTNLFSFRYYALSSTMISYIAYLQALIWWNEFLKGRQINLLLILMIAMPLMVFNHLQEPLFLLMSGATFLFIHWYQRFNEASKRLAVQLLVFFLFTGILFGWVATHNFPWIYSQVGIGEMSKFGNYPIWKSGYHWAQTFGVSGILGVFFAMVLFRSNPGLYAFCLTPTIVLLFPPTATALSRILPDSYSSYRILFAAPLSIPLVAGLWTGIEKFKKPIAERIAWIGVFLLSVIPSYPWRGRLFFQLYPSSAILALKPELEVAFWLNKYRPDLSSKRILLDMMTRDFLTSYLGWNIPYAGIEGHRINPGRYFSNQKSIKGVDEMEKFILEVAPDGILIADTQSFPKIPRSIIGENSGHWESTYADPKSFVSENLRVNCDQLVEKRNWIRTKVHPFYFLYEPRGKDLRGTLLKDQHIGYTLIRIFNR